MPIMRALAANKRWGLALGIPLLLIGHAPRSANAQEQPGSPRPATSVPAPRRTVDLLIRSSPAGEDTKALEDTIRELLSRLSITVVNRANGIAPAPGSLLATVDVDLVDPNGVHVVVRSATRSVVLDRTIPRDSNPAISREQIASTVRGATEAEILVDEDRVAGRVPPVVDEPDVSPPSSTPPIEASIGDPPAGRERAEQKLRLASPSSFAINLSTFAGGGMFADESPVVRVGGAIGIASQRAGVLRPGFALAALYTFPFESGDRTLEARASVASLRALPAVEVFRAAAPRFALDLTAGGGIDVLTVDPASKVLPESAFPEGKTTRVNPILTGGVSGRFAVASDVALTITVMTDVDLTTRRYVFDDRGQPRDVLVPWTVRPMLLAGLSFTAFGSSSSSPNPSASRPP